MKALATLMLALAPGLAYGQAADHTLSFDVASVKPAAAGARGAGMRGGPGSADPGRAIFTNVALRALIANAYNLPDDQISAPDWLSSARYDVEAKVPAGATKEQFNTMLQNLLSERFKLEFHRQKKDFTVYELVVAKGGSKLKESNGDAPSRSGVSDRGGPVDKEGFPMPPDHQTAQRSVNGVALMAGNQITTDILAQQLRFPLSFLSGDAMAQPFSARVVNKTGLSGDYDIKLRYQWPLATPSGAPGTAAEPDSAPTLFVALQQQLGLRFEQSKQSLDVLVIDRAEKTPAEN